MNCLTRHCLATIAILALAYWFISPSIAQSGVAVELEKRVIKLLQAGKYAEAIPLAQQALAIQEKLLGPDHPAVATALNNLAVLYYDQGRYADAEPLFKRSLAIQEKSLGPDHPDVARALNNLAVLYYDQGRYADAEPLYKRSLAIQEKALGPDHPDVARALNNLAVLYYDQGRYADAEPLYKRSLAIQEKALGPDHPDVAQALNNLAVLYYDQGRYADAEPLFKRSLAIQEKPLGPDHPDVAQSVHPLAAPALQPTPSVPQFPWPPPTASATYVLPDKLFESRGTVGDVTAAIVAALENNGYVELSFFQTPAGGVAMVTRLERINTDGSSAAEDKRWPATQNTVSNADLLMFLRGLFFVDAGHYRVIVFILQDLPFAQSPQKPTREEARGWLRSGVNVLPPEIAERPFKGAHCTVLVYQFASDGTDVRLIESPLTGKQHLEKAGVLSLLEKVN